LNAHLMAECRRDQERTTRGKPGTVALDGRPHLASVRVPATDVAAYGALLAGEGSR